MEYVINDLANDNEVFNSNKNISSSDSDTSNSSKDEDILLLEVASILHEDTRNSIQNYLEVVEKYRDEEFIRHFRINRLLFTEIVSKYRNSEQYKRLMINKKVKSPDFHLLVFLWFAGHQGCSFSDLSDRFNITQSSVHRIIRRMLLFISSLAPEVIKWPNREEMEITSEFYYNKLSFPGVIGKNIKNKKLSWSFEYVCLQAPLMERIFILIHLQMARMTISIEKEI